ncbi:hypothetical protein Anapl_16986 [Anas platyrhynchos]|uniref:Uncharacterized protein n=1 Tax=Anas platyrhynchos TaxID=8839 RepID=R0LA04_ANAPL|nr:hypothetical protein Anapl_16986 [Anas platyrhynchos]
MLLLQHLHVAGLREASRNLLPTFPGHRQLGRLARSSQGQQEEHSGTARKRMEGIVPPDNGAFFMLAFRQGVLKSFGSADPNHLQMPKEKLRVRGCGKPDLSREGASE